MDKDNTRLSRASRLARGEFQIILMDDEESGDTTIDHTDICRKIKICSNKAASAIQEMDANIDHGEHKKSNDENELDLTGQLDIMRALLKTKYQLQNLSEEIIFLTAPIHHTSWLSTNSAKSKIRIAAEDNMILLSIPPLRHRKEYNQDPYRIGLREVLEDANLHLSFDPIIWIATIFPARSIKFCDLFPDDPLSYTHVLHDYDNCSAKDALEDLYNYFALGNMPELRYINISQESLPPGTYIALASPEITKIKIKEAIYSAFKNSQ